MIRQRAQISVRHRSGHFEFVLRNGSRHEADVARWLQEYLETKEMLPWAEVAASVPAVLAQLEVLCAEAES